MHLYYYLGEDGKRVYTLKVLLFSMTITTRERPPRALLPSLLIPVGGKSVYCDI